MTADYDLRDRARALGVETSYWDVTGQYHEGKRKIAGAAIDVFDVEPLSAGHPFRKLDNVLATPHIGYVTEDLYRTFYGDAAACIAEWLENNP